MSEAIEVTPQMEIVAALETNSSRRKKREGELRELRQEADALVIAGDLAGVPKLTLARAAGLTRQTVYSVLLRAKAGS